MRINRQLDSHVSNCKTEEMKSKTEQNFVIHLKAKRKKESFFLIYRLLLVIFLIRG